MLTAEWQPTHELSQLTWAVDLFEHHLPLVITACPESWYSFYCRLKMIQRHWLVILR